MQNNTADAPHSLRLMCLGDSITDGFWLEGGYRNTLCRLISENGQEPLVRLVGPNRSGTGYSPYHAGFCAHSTVPIAASISGPRRGITEYLDTLTAGYPADIVFLQIGTNDILSLYELTQFGQRIRSIAEQLLNAFPEGCRLFLATLPQMDASVPLYITPDFFTVSSMDETVAQCNAQIRKAAAQLRAEGRDVRIADVAQVLHKSDLYDGVHPSEAGYEKLGRFWYQQLMQCIPQQAQVTIQRIPIQQIRRAE